MKQTFARFRTFGLSLDSLLVGRAVQRQAVGGGGMTNEHTHTNTHTHTHTQHNTTQHNTTQHNTTQHNTTQKNTKNTTHLQHPQHKKKHANTTQGWRKPGLCGCGECCVCLSSSAGVDCDMSASRVPSAPRESLNVDAARPVRRCDVTDGSSVGTCREAFAWQALWTGERDDRRVSCRKKKGGVGGGGGEEKAHTLVLNHTHTRTHAQTHTRTHARPHVSAKHHHHHLGLDAGVAR